MTLYAIISMISQDAWTQLNAYLLEIKNAIKITVHCVIKLADWINFVFLIKIHKNVKLSFKMVRIATIQMLTCKIKFFKSSWIYWIIKEI
jgi:hypothetical protein